MTRTVNVHRSLIALVRGMSDTAAMALLPMATLAAATADADDISDVETGSSAGARKRTTKAAPAAKPTTRRRAKPAADEDDEPVAKTRTRRAAKPEADEPAAKTRTRRTKVEGFPADTTENDLHDFIEDFEVETLPEGGIRELTAALKKYEIPLDLIEGTRKERTEEMGTVLALAQTLEARLKKTDEDTLGELAEELDIDGADEMTVAKLALALTVELLGESDEDEDEDDAEDEDEDEDEAPAPKTRRAKPAAEPAPRRRRAKPAAEEPEDEDDAEEEEPAPRRRRRAVKEEAPAKRRRAKPVEEDLDEGEDDLDDIEDID